MPVSGTVAPQIAAVLWLFLGVVFAVGEGLTVQLISIWFALGAAGAAISAMVGASFLVQCAVFLVVSVLSLFATRPLLKSKLLVHKESTNADRVIGETGIVTETIENDLDKGRVRVLGMDWSARSQDSSVIEQGSKVLVRSIQGVRVIVELRQNAEAE